MACISRFATAILSGETELVLGTIRVKTVKIAKSKADVFKMLGSVPHSEVRAPRLVSRPCTCKCFTFHEALDV